MRQTDSGFTIAVNLFPVRRDRLADQLTWLATGALPAFPRIDATNGSRLFAAQHPEAAGWA
ncbi:MAG TPA: hypothetical protein VIG36_14605 [Methylocystis sp.]